jgi:hypothetical protein
MCNAKICHVPLPEPSQGNGYDMLITKGWAAQDQEASAEPTTAQALSDASEALVDSFGVSHHQQQEPGQALQPFEHVHLDFPAAAAVSCQN